mmetsp:Transcript_32716/g.74786  ORF Transcript_32716/g.74786 Transcript_32716/m.74786 type:complete len:102 (+) Transcript_32716:1338-1643(+)
MSQLQLSVLPDLLEDSWGTVQKMNDVKGVDLVSSSSPLRRPLSASIQNSITLCTIWKQTPAQWTFAAAFVERLGQRPYEAKEPLPKGWKSSMADRPLELSA